MSKQKTEKNFDFLIPYYPIPSESGNEEISFYYKQLKLLSVEDFTRIFKEELEAHCLSRTMNILRSLFVKDTETESPGILLTYKVTNGNKTDLFQKDKIVLNRDIKYYKNTTTINFIAGCYCDSNGTIFIIHLPLSQLIKQIKSKCVVGKFSAKKYEDYMLYLNETFKKNPDRLLPLRESNMSIKDTPLTSLIRYFLPGLKASKIESLIQLIRPVLQARNIKKVDLDNSVIELKGEAIRYFYNCKNYSTAGMDGGSTLHNSCMRHNSNYEQLEFYSNNPKSVSLLVALDKKNPRKIAARTILWTSVDGVKAVDRIYSALNEDALRIVTYCKVVGYSTVYDSVASSYGLQLLNDFVLKVEKADDSKLPYFDTMRYWERINNLLGSSDRAIRKYCEDNKLDFSLTSKGYYYDSCSLFSIKGCSTEEYIIDVSGNPIRDYSSIIAVDLPYKGFSHRDNVVLYGYPLRKRAKIAKTFLKKMHKKYNNVRDAYCRVNENNYVKYKDDISNLIYSDALKKFIDRKDSYFNYNLNSYIYKESFNDSLIQELYRVRRLRNIYNGKCVSLTVEGYEQLKNMNKNLTVPFNIIKVRPSRKFKISGQYIKSNGILLKDILVPFKHLKIIKHNGEN